MLRIPMKRANNLRQNTKDWYAWRNKGLGASNAPAVMGASPWTTRFQLWAEMTGLLPRPDFHPRAVSAMERGKLLEPTVRQWYTFKTGLTLESDVNCEHETHEFLRASLDGWRDEDQIVREIKCPGKVDHATAVKGRVPTKYIPQVQAQLMVTGSQKAEYISFDGEDGVILPVLRDDVYIARLEAASVAFWRLVQTKTPPEATPGDLVSLSEAFGALTTKLHQYSGAINLLATLLSQKKAS
jgi:putative phage-type endonuclease